MFIKKIAFFAILISLLWVSDSLAEIKEGLWKITTKTEIKNAPVQIPATTVKQCITKNNPVPQPTAKDYVCETKHTEIKGDTVTYLIECTGKNSAMLILGETIYKGNSFNGTSTATVKNFGQPDVQINNIISGRHIGPCKK